MKKLYYIYSKTKTGNVSECSGQQRRSRSDLWPLTSDLQVQFQSEQADVLGQVTLPASLLAAAAAEGSSPPSRINFMFFSSTNLFQVSGGEGQWAGPEGGAGPPLIDARSPPEGAAGPRPQ